MDNYCNWECHDINKDGIWNDPPEQAASMRHSKDVAPGGPNEWSVQFGTHLTQSAVNADTILGVPIDVDLNTDAAAAGAGAYAPCVSCHDPHGTNTVKPPGKPSNYMMRFEWTGNTLCSKCHI